MALLGILLLCAALAQWLRPGRQPEGPEARSAGGEGLHRVLTSFAVLAGYVLAIGYLGYLLSTALFFVVYFRLFAPYRWASVLASSVALAVASASLWSALGVMLPEGVLPWL